MSAIEIIQVTDKKGIKAFVDFNHRLYRNCPYIAPEIREDMLYTLDPHQNDAFEFCDCACYLARRDGKTVGRVAAIINRKANAKWNVRVVRFGWIDFIDDIEVARSLLEQVEAFGRRHGMTVMQGPWALRILTLRAPSLKALRSSMPWAPSTIMTTIPACSSSWA